MKISLFSNIKNGLPYPLFFSAALSLIFVGLSFFLIWSNYEKFPIAVPLWFSKPWGDQWLAPPSQLWILPIASSCFFLLNFILARIFWVREKILSWILIWTTPIIGLIFFYTLLEIIRLTS
jgi:hypothetical protein